MSVPPVRLGIVGCGSLTERGLLPHLRLEKERVAVTALCDISRERLTDLGERFHVNRRFTDYTEFLAEAPVDAVALATPMQLHYGQAREALEAGRHVYVQKTIAGTGREARDLLRVADRGGLTLAASPGQMALPAYARAKEIAEGGRLGDVLMAIGAAVALGHEHEALRSRAEGNELDPAWYYASGGGPVRDMGVYPLHAVTGILGPVQTVHALGTRRGRARSWHEGSIRVEVDEGVVLSLRLSGGVLATVTAGYAMAPGYLHWGHLAISGSAGALEVRRTPEALSQYELILQTSERGTPHRERFGTGLSPPHDALEEAHVARDLLDFADAIRDSRPPLARAEDACHVVDVIEAGEEAARRGSPQSVPSPPAR